MPLITVTAKSYMGALFFREHYVKDVPSNLNRSIDAFFDIVDGAAAPARQSSSLAEQVQVIDRFRDRVSACYGFRRELIEPVYVANPDNVLKDCAFDVLGIGYEVKNTKLTCTGEVKDDDR